MSAVKFGSCRDETCYTSVSVRLAIKTLIWCQRKFSCASTSTGRCESICAWAVKDYVGKTYTKSPSRSATTVSATTVFAKWRWLYSIFLLATQYEMFVFEAGGRPALYCNKVDATVNERLQRWAFWKRTNEALHKDWCVPYSQVSGIIYSLETLHTFDRLFYSY